VLNKKAKKSFQPVKAILDEVAAIKSTQANPIRQ
jgi:hypothetical protein